MFSTSILVQSLHYAGLESISRNESSDHLFSQAPLEDLRKHFDQAVQERRFCNVDIAHMWAHDPRWRQFVKDTFAKQQRRVRNTSNQEQQEQREEEHTKEEQ